jgi:hypothetical protein
MEPREHGRRGPEEVAQRAAGAVASVFRVGFGVAFLASGALKLLPGASPAEDLATRAIEVASSGLLDPGVSLPSLAACECAIGLATITGRYVGWALALMFALTCGTVLPLFFFPDATLGLLPHAETAAGEYTLRSVVLVGAGVAVGVTRRGSLLPAPAVAGGADPGRVAAVLSPTHASAARRS